LAKRIDIDCRVDPHLQCVDKAPQSSNNAQQHCDPDGIVKLLVSGHKNLGTGSDNNALTSVVLLLEVPSLKMMFL
jgi:hypothetical protein